VIDEVEAASKAREVTIFMSFDAVTILKVYSRKKLSLLAQLFRHQKDSICSTGFAKVLRLATFLRPER
jgi:hypothetical protein